MRISLRGKWALVCGASQGIGAAAAKELSELDANVILLSRDLEKLQAVKSSLKNPDAHKVLSFDLSDFKNLKNFLEKNLKDAEIPTILVNNAGGPPAGPLTQVAAEDFQNALGAHVCAAQELLRFALPKMKELKYGRVINVISTSVKAPLPNLGLSNTVRGAMASWSKTMAMELGAFNITVNNVLPGYTETPRLESLAQKASEKNGTSVEQVKSQWKESIPMKRFGKPQETGEVIAFLATEAAGYINGINVPVDGGRTQSL